jgi:hypothetical protein
MSEDTQKSGYKDKILSILHAADEAMLRESGNEVYIKMRAQLDRYQ